MERAVAAKKSKREYDQIWVVFDVDEHPKLAEAHQQARSNHLNVAQSNPCFELWALLHFQDQTAELTRHHAQRLCRQHMPGYEKLLPYAQLSGRVEAACARAEQLREQHTRNGTARGNPSTDVDFLVRVMLGAPSSHKNATSIHAIHHPQN